MAFTAMGILGHNLCPSSSRQEIRQLKGTTPRCREREFYQSGCLVEGRAVQWPPKPIFGVLTWGSCFNRRWTVFLNSAGQDMGCSALSISVWLWSVLRGCLRRYQARVSSLPHRQALSLPGTRTLAFPFPQHGTLGNFESLEFIVWIIC